MGGFPQQLNQDPTQQLEQQGDQSQARLGQALQQQQTPSQPSPQPQPSQPGSQPGGGDPIAMAEGYWTQKLQQSQQQQVQQGGRIKSLLGNFFGTMLGQPSPQSEAAIATNKLNQLETNKAMIGLHQAQMAPYQMVPMLGGDGKPIVDNDGNQVHVPAMYAQQMQMQLLKNAGTQNVAQIGANTKMSLGALQLAISQGAVARIEPAQDEQGQFVQRAYNKFGQAMGDLQGALPPAAFLSKMSTTQDFKQDENGNYIAIPKTTVTRPMIPGMPGGASPSPGAPSGTPGVPGAPAQPGQPRIVGHGKPPTMVVGTDPQGNQVAGLPEELRGAGVQNFTQLGASEAAKVNTARQLTSPTGLFALADRDLAQFKPGELEGLAPRWNEFLAGSVGTADPRYVALRTHVNGLLATAMMQAHVGARGGGEMMEHFQDMANAGKMSQGTLRAALGAEREYVQEKAMRPTPLGGGASGVGNAGGKMTAAQWLSSRH